jgi:cyanophycinase-like exopeptidase
MGSGETTPTMVETHKRVLGALGPDPDAVLLDTPYGFQENADEITERTVAYFARNVEATVRPVTLRSVGAVSTAVLETAIERIAEADWVFAGPGSPTYLLHQWAQSRLPDVLKARLGRAGAMVFASAAVCTLGTHTLPVYEIYKVGQTPRWEPGLEVLVAAGLRCVAIPHFDNAEGGTHDTRYCYLGEQRLRFLEEQLPDDVWVLGIDEHTAMIVDLEEDTVTVEGRGGVTVRRRDGSTVIAAGQRTTLAEMRAIATGASGGTTSTAPATPPEPAPDEPAPPGGLLEAVEPHAAAFERALADDDAIGAADAVLAIERTIHEWAADTQQSDEVGRARDLMRRLVVKLARVAQQGLHDHRRLVATPVETLLDLRRQARTDRDYATADQIRDALAAGGVEVRDTPDGAEWDFDEERTGSN